MVEHSEYREEFPAEGHPYTYDHTEPKYSLLFILGGVTVVLLILVTIGITYYYDNLSERQIATRVLAVDNEQLKNLRTTEDQELHSYGIDKATGKVRITIDRAMELVAQDAAQNAPKYPTNSYPVKTDQQVAAASPAVSQPGAAAANAAQKQGTGSSPDVQPSPKPNQ
jgi:hypothetical protein